METKDIILILVIGYLLYRMETDAKRVAALETKVGGLKEPYTKAEVDALIKGLTPARAADFAGFYQSQIA